MASAWLSGFVTPGAASMTWLYQAVYLIHYFCSRLPCIFCLFTYFANSIVTIWFVCVIDFCLPVSSLGCIKAQEGLI